MKIVHRYDHICKIIKLQEKNSGEKFCGQELTIITTLEKYHCLRTSRGKIAKLASQGFWMLKQPDTKYVQWKELKGRENLVWFYLQTVEPR